MASLAISRIRIVEALAGMAVLAVGLSGCIDTSRMTGPKITPPQEPATSLEYPADDPALEASIAKMDEANLVQNVVFHRTMYARFLHILSTFYSEQGFPEKAAWAQTELNSLRRVKTYRYLSDAEPPRAAASPAASGPEDRVVMLVAYADPPSAKQSVDPQPEPPQEPAASLEHPAGLSTPDIPIEKMGEADLVENATLHRAMYHRFLAALTTYYSEQGYTQKAAWAQTELAGLRRIKTYKYLMDAEVPRADLKPTESIAEADKLYDQGMTLLFKGGRGLPCFYNQATMRLALIKFKELVDKYPTSDKIDDAAYYIGEIHKEYEKEKDNGLAIAWYKRAIQWDPNTPHPCRYRIATTYDYRLHEREQALFWYQKVLEEEAKFDSLGGDFTLNVKFANGRIRELTPKEHLESPGEAVSDGRPAPAAPPQTPPPAPPPTQPPTAPKTKPPAESKAKSPPRIP